MRLSRAEFERLVERALAEIPEPFASRLAEVAIDVEPMPDARTCREMDVDDPTELLGLYFGVPLTERTLDDPPAMGDRITLYQRNIERDCESWEEVVEEIRTTVLHEVGHHFGLDEDDLTELGYE
jgi:predicted Zn-dependent protease with MMP-like domain